MYTDQCLAQVNIASLYLNKIATWLSWLSLDKQVCVLFREREKAPWLCKIDSKCTKFKWGLEKRRRSVEKHGGCATNQVEMYKIQVEVYKK